MKINSTFKGLILVLVIAVIMIGFIYWAVNLPNCVRSEPYECDECTLSIAIDGSGNVQTFGPHLGPCIASVKSTCYACVEYDK